MVTFFGPWNLGRLLSDTFGIYSKKWFYYIAIVTPFIIITALVSWALDATITRWQDLAEIYESAELAFKALYIGIGFLLLNMLITMIVEAAMNCVLIHAMCQYYTRDNISLGKAYGQALKKLLTVFAAVLLRGLVMAALFITIIGIPIAIYFAIKWIFVTHAILLEGKSVTESLSRSSELTSENWWRIFGYLIVVLIIVFAAIFAMGLIQGFVGFTTEVNGFDFYVTIISIIAAPLSIIATTLLYFTLRVEKEGYHLGKLKTDLDAWDANKKPVYQADVIMPGQFYCSRCGTRQNSGTRFCSNCGRSFYEDAAPRQADDKPENSDDDTGNGPFIN